MATAIRIAHAIAIRFGEPSMSFGFGHRFGSKSIADRSIRIELLIDCEEDRNPPGGAGRDAA